jgi:hypothetical protein
VKASLPTAPQPAPGAPVPPEPLPLEQVDGALERAFGVVRRRGRLARAVQHGAWGAVAGAGLAIAVAGATRLGALPALPTDRLVPRPVSARLGLRGAAPAPLELLGLLLALGGGAVGAVVGASRRGLARADAYALLDASRGGALFGTLLELSPAHRFAPLVRAEAAAALPALDPRRALRVPTPRRALRLLGGALVAILVVAHAPTRRPGLAQAREVAALTSTQSLELERLEARLERVADDRGREALARAADGLADLRKGVAAGELTELAALARLGQVEEELRSERARIDARAALAKRLEDPAVRSLVAGGAGRDPTALSEPSARAAAREALRRASDDAANADPRVAEALTRAVEALRPDGPPEQAEQALEELRRALADQPPTYSDALTRQAIEQATPKLEGVRAAFQSSRPAPTELAQAPTESAPPGPATEQAPTAGPQGGTERGPQGGTERGPQGGTERGPQGGTERGPEGGTERGPQGGTERGPQGGTERGPQGGTERGPQGGTERGPQGGTERGPQGGTERGPQGGTERGPQGGGTERGPQGGTERGPQGGTERGPQGGTERGPQGGTERGPQGGTERGPQPATEASPRPDDPRQARTKPPAEDRPAPTGAPSEPPPEMVMNLAQSLGEQLLGAMSADDLASLAELARDMKGEAGQDPQTPPTPDAMRDMADRFQGLDPALQKKLAEAAAKMKPAEGQGEAPSPPQGGPGDAAADEATRRDMEQRLARLDPGVRRALESAARQQAANAGGQPGAGAGEPGQEGQAGRPGTPGTGPARPGEGRPGEGPGAGEPGQAGGPEGPGGQARPLGVRPGPGGAADPAGSADPTAEVTGEPSNAQAPGAVTESASDRPTFFPSAEDGPRVGPGDDGVIHDDEETTGGARSGSRVPFDAAVRASHDAAIEALGRQRVPEAYERAVREYFDRARRAAESPPPKR